MAAFLLVLSVVVAVETAAPEPPPPAAAPIPISAPAHRAAAPPSAAPRLIGEPGASASPPDAPPSAVAPAAGAASSSAGAPAVAGSAAPGSPPPRSPAPLPQAAVEKMGQGDRAFLAHDYRTALFAYQDAVYLAPGNPSARVRLGRAYLALRYPAQAIAQAELALGADPESLEARRLIEEATRPPVRPAAPAPAQAPAQARTAPPHPAVQPGDSGGEPRPLVFRFQPEPEAPRTAATADPRAGAPAAPVARPPDEATASSGSPGPDLPGGSVAAAEVGAASARAAPVVGTGTAASAADLYRAAVRRLANREFDAAAAELTEAIALDPRLAVAYAARASARFGTGHYREAADDYRAALGLDPKLGTPLFGLAECYRVLGDSRNAAEMYRRYSESSASDVRADLRTIAAKRAQELR